MLAPLVMRWRQQGLSEASDSQDSVLMLKSFRETVLEAFSLTSACALAMTEFSREELLGDAIVRHTGDVTCPSKLGLVRDGGDAGEVSRCRTSVLGTLSCQRM